MVTPRYGILSTCQLTVQRIKTKNMPINPYSNPQQSAKLKKNTVASDNFLKTSRQNGPKNRNTVVYMLDPLDVAIA
jgi:hypothetical protein